MTSLALPTIRPQTVNELRLLEAQSAVAYFRAWYATSLLWRTSARHPIPDEWRTVGPRFTRVYATGSRNASHPVNAILNYAYAVLQSQVQIRSWRRAMIRCSASCTLTATERRLCFRHDGARTTESRPGGSGLPQIGGVASGGFHDQRRRGCEAQSGIREAGSRDWFPAWMRPRAFH